ncbi:hypothetical protein [Aestuariivirga sp.]|uniref:hypothetical protein n=1 Tax=Aestuariivirga sp. TaxID=2650926 RepID=UPI0025BDBD71|nr:hypothetical protein [Aestuariivirga sp.]MCA3554718.1 hypothetical protein [Aestuariivirga sp.]
MSYAQPNLFGEDQPDLFGPAAAPKADAYRVKPRHVLNRFAEFDALLGRAEVWPWDAARRADMRERTWPYLLAKLREIGCAEEARQWEAIMAAHAARLDAATPPEPAA